MYIDGMNQEDVVNCLSVTNWFGSVSGARTTAW